MNPDLEMLLKVKLPNGGKQLRAVIRVEEHIFQESFAPLPIDRELPFAVHSHIIARRQKKLRRDIANALARQLADKMIKLIESEDPQQGYSSEEWRQINSIDKEDHPTQGTKS
jgi:hypothetical protein